MTLAQNHLQRLNGSKPFFFLFILFIGLVSCDALKKVPREETDPKIKDQTELDEIQGQRTYNPKTGQYEYSTSVTEEVDTVKWTEVTEEEYPPIVTGNVGGNTGDSTGDGTVSGEKLSTYNVAVMLPFLTDKLATTSGIDDRSRLALDFYSGAKLAFEQLSREGVRLNVSVMDTKASESVVRGLLNRSEVYNANLIIGPVRTSNLKVVADFAKDNRKVLISPNNPSTSVTRNNPYYVQMNPSLKSHCEAITKHVKSRYETSQVVLVCRNKNAEVNRLKYFQNANKEIAGDDNTPRFRELIVVDQSADYNEMDVTPYILGGDSTTVFIVPSWSNESFIYSFLRKVNIAKQDQNVVVYGMPQWMKYQRISYDYYERLNLHVSSVSYIDGQNTAVQQFRQEFYSRYGAAPDDNAFVGYDVTRYIGKMISEYGTDFQTRLDVRPEQLLYNQFTFSPNAAEGSTGEEPKVNWYENNHVNILKFEDFYFQLAQ